MSENTPYKNMIWSFRQCSYKGNKMSYRIFLNPANFSIS